MNKRPHIIIFNPDEMRADSLAHLGNPAAVTPNLDAFAREDAVSFSKAFCQNPVCVPSRCSFFTGLYPHVKGHRTMSHLLRPGEDSLFSELRRSGYYVWMNDRNDLTAGQIPGWTESNADEIFYSGQCRKAPGPKNASVRGCPGNKDYYSHFEGELGLDEKGRNYTSDDEVVDAAIERLRNPVDDRPMCLFLGLMYPHTPYGVEEPYFSAIQREKLAERIRPGDCEGKAKILSEIRKYQGMEDYTESDWDELRAVYLGMCMKIDAQFGRLVKALKDEGIYDDCAIFVLSDHGDFTGDYGLSEKAQNSFEDCLTRVPFLIKPPKGVSCRPGISPSLVELVDFYATAMDLAGVTPSHTHFGRSLRPQLENPELPARKYVFCEGGRMPGEYHCDEFHASGKNGPPETLPYWPKMMAQTDDMAHSKGIMMRSERFKYVSRSLGNDEFYDLREDPGETKNRIDDPEFFEVITKMRLDMLKWLQATDDIVPFDYDLRFTPEMMWAKVRQMVAPEDETLVREKIKEGISHGKLQLFCRELSEKRKVKEA
ncbi:arylsulfatase A family protein [Lachnospiraceae bacterium JC7]|nr:arylsulfatase A family protein [Lachnospiraceae bacterium JC7]